MAQCTFHDSCGLETGEGESYCILHSRNPTKPHRDFATVLDHHRKAQGDTFTFFYFPSGQHFPKGSPLQEASFIGATFAGRVTFADVEFKGNTNFSGVTFTNAV